FRGVRADAAEDHQHGKREHADALQFSDVENFAEVDRGGFFKCHPLQRLQQLRRSIDAALALELDEADEETFQFWMLTFQLQRNANRVERTKEGQPSTANNPDDPRDVGQEEEEA